MKKFGSLILVVMFMMVGCSGSDKGAASGKDGDMVARVGDKIISGKQIDKFLENLPPQVSARYGAARIRREIADGFVSMEMLAWEARKRGIDKREDVKLKMDLIVDQSLARELEEDIRKGIKVSDADTKKYYDEHQDKYGARTRVFARQIMLASEPEAKSAADKIKKGGNFEDLAKQLSKDPETSLQGWGYRACYARQAGSGAGKGSIQPEGRRDQPHCKDRKRVLHHSRPKGWHPARKSPTKR